MSLINWLFSALMTIITLAFSSIWYLITLVFRIILAVVAGIIAVYKRRSGLLWGAIVFFFPIAIIALPFIPKKYPKLRGDIAKEPAFKGKNPVIASIMAISAMVAKSSGSITKDDINSVKKFIASNFNVSSNEMNEYADAFEYGKNHPHEYKEFARVIRAYYKGRNLTIPFLLMGIAMNNGEISPEEDELLGKIFEELGLSAYEYTSYKQAFYRGNQSYGGFDGFGGFGGFGYQGSYGSQGNYGQGMGGGPSKASLIKKYSEVLGVSEEASMAEIKKAYRKLAKEYHPDKLAGENAPEEYLEFAKNKIIEINEAYEYLKQVKE